MTDVTDRRRRNFIPLNSDKTTSDTTGKAIMNSGFEVDLTSLRDTANLLLEISGLLRAGRMDHDYGTRARAPYAHRELGVDVDRFARFADDQYGDLTLLLFALSSKLEKTGADYRTTDFDIQLKLDEILAGGQYVKPEDR